MPLALPHVEPAPVPAPSSFPLPGAASPAPAGGVTLLEGAWGDLGEAEARVILDVIGKSLDVLLVSGDNRLDAFGLLARARALRVEDALADGLVLARAFTVHQLAALVEESLPRMARERPAGRVGVALVTGLLEPFRDADVRPGEARALLRRVLRSLAAWSASSGVPVVATFTPGPYADAAREARFPVRRVAPPAPRPPMATRTLDRFAAAGVA